MCSFLRRLVSDDLPAGLLWSGLLAVALLGAGVVADDVQRRPVQEGPKAERAKAPGLKRIGRVISVDLPITNDVAKTVKQTVDATLRDLSGAGQRPVLIFDFRVRPNHESLAKTSEYGPAVDLAGALSSETLNGAATIAYVPQPIEGHADLVVLACQQIVMGPDAQLGPVGKTEWITNGMRGEYREKAERNKKIPAEVALGLLDSRQRVLAVETDAGTEFKTPDELDELKKTRTIQSQEVLFDGAQPARLTADVARKYGFIDFKAQNIRELARQLDLAPESVKTALVQDFRAVRVDLVGPISDGMIDHAKTLIKDAILRRNVNFVCLWIDSPGGSMDDSASLASFLVSPGLIDPSRIRTVAYVPAQARADATLVALACDEVIVGPHAIFGGDGAHVFTDREVAAGRVDEERICVQKNRSWSLPAAILDRNVTVYRCTRPGEERFYCDEELDKQPDQAKWQKEGRVTQPGKVFEAIGPQAQEFLLADAVLKNFDELKQRYNLEKDPTLLEPGWADELVQALASPWLSVILLMIAFAATYAELHTPGMGVGGFVAAVCFALFFWSRFLGGTAGWLEVTLFAAGVACLLLEIFVLPGFAIFGLGGGLLIIASLVLASQTFALPHNDYQFAQFQQSLLILAGAVGGTICLAMILNRWLPKTPVLGRIVHQPFTEEELARVSHNESLAHFDALLGARGTATTQLVPGGKALFGERLVDVMADGQFIERGQPVEVVEVEGYRVIVRPADET
jgi:membrane-bound ClpP family serine protease